MTPDKTDSFLKRELSGLTRGACPDSETLSRFLLGELDEAGASEVKRHIARCGECDLVAVKMKQFDRQEPLAVVGTRRWGWFPMLGYALALVLAIPAVRSLTPVKPVGGPPLRTTPVVELNSERGPGGRAVVTGNFDFVMSFQIPVVEGRRYDAALEGRTGKKLGPFAITPDDRLGNFHVMVARSSVDAGEWRLRVNETGGTDREFLFDFSIQ
jgi:hypothetical protein